MSRVKKLKPKQVYIMANGDLRLSANQVCWAEQSKMEATLAKALKVEGWTVVRVWEHEPAADAAEKVAQALG